MGGSRDTGLFGPGSLTWRVNREGSLLIGGATMIDAQSVAIDEALQSADPLVELIRLVDPRLVEDESLMGQFARLR